MSRWGFGFAFWYVTSIEENPRMKISVKEIVHVHLYLSGPLCMLLCYIGGADTFTFKILFLMLIDKFESFL